MSGRQCHATGPVIVPNLHCGFSSSPESSGEIESRCDTPETKLSTFSPEHRRAEQKLSAYNMKSSLPPTFHLSHPQAKTSPKGKASDSKTHGSHDPFVITSTYSRIFNDQPKLSPTASSFTPQNLIGSAISTGTSHPPNFANFTSNSTTGSLGVGYLAANSVPDISSSDPQLKNYLLSLAGGPMMSPISPGSFSSSDGSVTTAASSKVGQFSSDDDTSRSLMISKVDRKTSIKELDDFFNVYLFSSLKHVVLVDLATTGIIYLYFADIRDANKAHSKVQNIHRDWSVQYIAITQLAKKRMPESMDFPPVSVYEGQVMVKAEFFGPRQRFDTGSIGHLIKEMLENYGDIMAYNVSLAESQTVAVRAEYYDTAAADSALAYLNGFKIGGCTLSIVYYKPDLESTLRQQVRAQGPMIVGHDDTGLNGPFGLMSLSSSNDLCGLDQDHSKSAFTSSYSHVSPVGGPMSYRGELFDHQAPYSHSNFTGYNGRQDPHWAPCYGPYPACGIQSPPWSLYGPGAIGQERTTPSLPQHRAAPYPHQERAPGKMSGRQHHDYASGHHNVVDVERIRQGTDVRTTIMLRNIPNKIDQAMLKDIVDETSRGKYDFMYLRIDFANNCNVGYAFINFEDPYFITDFVNARAGHRWSARNRYNSDKVAEVSYATIQGRDCLVQKFRNSSVMLEHPSFRPKIFHTGSGALSGTEDQFPGPDNPSKMRRSVENAEHVGLFAPRAGQNFRDEQRRRRSQYDRGTRLAEIEDAYDFDHEDRNGTNYFLPGSSYGKYRGIYSMGY